MRSLSRILHARRSRRELRARDGFTLVELSVVLAIISVIAVMGLEMTAQYMNRTAYKVTQERLEAIDQAIVRYVKTYNKIPCPAYATLIITDACYGKEGNGSVGPGSTCTDTKGTCYVWGIAGTDLQYGDVPVRDLGLPLSHMVDGYGSRIRYVASGYQSYSRTYPGPGGRHFENTPDAIEVRSGKLDSACGVTGQLCQKRGMASYFVFSLGADRRGAGTPNNMGPNPSCNLGVNFAKVDGYTDTQNCRFGNAMALVKNGSTVISPAIPNNVFYDSRYNNGTTDAHFDDIVKWRSKGNL